MSWIGFLKSVLTQFHAEELHNKKAWCEKHLRDCGNCEKRCEHNVAKELETKEAR